MTQAEFDLFEIHAEARRMVDRSCGIYEDPRALAERTRRYEAALTEKAYRRAIQPYIDLKCKLMLHFLPDHFLVQQADGTLKLESREAMIPQETRDVLATIDQAINEIADDYMRLRPFPTGIQPFPTGLSC